MKTSNVSVLALSKACCALLFGLASCTALAAGTTTRLNLSASGVEANQVSLKASASTDGRYVVYQSRATNQMPGVTSGLSHIYLLDRESGLTQLVSRTPGGAPGNGDSDSPSISADGRFIAFQSASNNLLGVGGDTNQFFDIFVFDRNTGQITRASVASDGQQANFHSLGPTISANGRYVAFHSKAANLSVGDTNNVEDIFVHDRETGATQRVSVASGGGVANERSFAPSLSADGRYLSFFSRASNLVAGDTNNREDVFVYDRQLGHMQRISVATNGAQASGASSLSSISADGRFIAFQSVADNLVSSGSNGATDVFVHDRLSGQTQSLSVSHTGAPTDGGSFRPHISADGRFVAFHSDATNLIPGDTNQSTDVFLYDRSQQKMLLISTRSNGALGNHYSLEPYLVNNGRSVLFRSGASNLVDHDENERDDIFIHDIIEDMPPSPFGMTSMATLSSEGQQTPGFSYVYEPAVSGDGRYVTYRTNAANLVLGDTNTKWDIFVFDRGTHTTTRASVSSSGIQANGDSQSPKLSEDGRYLVFVSFASNLIVGDTNGQMDVFLKDRYSGQVSRISLAADGSQANQGSFEANLSADGRFVVFSSNASNLVPGDTNGSRDIFVKNLHTGQLRRVSLSSDGVQANNWSFFPSISADGRYIAFQSNANNLVPGDTNGSGDVFVHDLQTAQTTRVSVASGGAQGNSLSYSPHISGDGQTVVFHSTASSLVGGDTNGYADVFAHNRLTGETELISVSGSDGFANGHSYTPRVSADGTRVVFYSYASDVVANDLNLKPDVFMRDRLLNKTTLISVSSGGEQGNKMNYNPDVDHSGRVVVYMSDSYNLVSPDTNGSVDVFVNERAY